MKVNRTERHSEWVDYEFNSGEFAAALGIEPGHLIVSVTVWGGLVKVVTTPNDVKKKAAGL